MDSFSVTIETWHLYLFAKLAIGVGLVAWERKYIKMGWSQTVGRFLYHASLNPELGISKGAVALPLWLLLRRRIGSGFFYHFMPIKTGVDTSIRRPRCRVCSDTGRVKEAFRKYRQCTCQVDPQASWLRN